MNRSRSASRDPDGQRLRDGYWAALVLGLTFCIGIAVSVWARQASRPASKSSPVSMSIEGIVGWPQNVDAVASLAAVRATMDDLALSGITAYGVRSDGRVDLTRGDGTVRYGFQAARPVAPDPKSSDTHLMKLRCPKRVAHLRRDGFWVDPEQRTASCPTTHKQPLPAPTCGMQDVWKLALSEGAPDDRLARIEYRRSYSGPQWRLSIAELGFEIVVSPDCRRILHTRRSRNRSR